MERLGRLLLLGLLSLVLVVFSAFGPSRMFFAQGDCFDTLKADVQPFLPSLEDFRLIKLAELNLSSPLRIRTFEFPLPDGQEVKVQLNLKADFSSIPSDLFLVKEYDSNGNAISEFTPPLLAYRGGIPDQDASLAALYVGHSGYISGFVHFDVNDLAASWAFIELLEPLLTPLSGVPSDVLGCARQESIHIVYDARQTEFRMNLEPKPTPDDLQTRIVDNIITVKSPVTVLLVGIGDSAFYNLYQSQIESKQWWEAQAEVLSMVSDFYEDQLTDVKFQMRSLEAWTGEAWAGVGPGAAILGGTAAAVYVGARAAGGNLKPGDIEGDGVVDINAFNLLCNFAQGFTIRDLDRDGMYAEGIDQFSLPESAPEADPITYTPATNPMVAHLFTGYDLGPIPSEGLSDSGCCFCPTSSCGSDGKDIVGVAEGIGLWNDTSTICQATELRLPQRAHHSLSEHAPKSTDCASSANCNYDALLIQRLLLVAHEIGHNLGAEHSQDHSVMFPNLDTLGDNTLGELGLGMSFDRPSSPRSDETLKSNIDRIEACLKELICDQ